MRLSGLVVELGVLLKERRSNQNRIFGWKILEFEIEILTGFYGHDLVSRYNFS